MMLRIRLWRIALIVFAIPLLAGVGVLLFIRSGFYDVAATRQHTAPVYWVLSKTKVWSVRMRAKDISVPEIADDALARGERAYLEHCAQCHGAPGMARDEVGRGMTPVPPNLAQTARDMSAAEIFWITKYGIKSTGMPGWDYRMPDEDIWEIVGFVETLPSIVPSAYRARHGQARRRNDRDGMHSSPKGDMAASGNPDRGRLAIHQYACTACHTVPGVPGPDTVVGPPLWGMAGRRYIAGVLVNTPENMVRWLTNPPAVDPLTAMPDLEVSPTHARDIAAYLETLAAGTPSRGGR